MGRPKLPIDAEQVYKLARLGCTQDEIGDILGCSAQTISARFPEEYSRARAGLKMSLRRAQVRRAIKDRSDTMLVHLGEVYLGQGGKVDGDELRNLLHEALSPRDGEGTAGEVSG